MARNVLALPERVGDRRHVDHADDRSPVADRGKGHACYSSGVRYAVGREHQVLGAGARKQPARERDVGAADRFGDVGEREGARLERAAVHVDVNLAAQPAGHGDLRNAVDPLEAPLEAVLGEVARFRKRLPRQLDRRDDDRAVGGVVSQRDGLLDRAREIGANEADLLADMERGQPDVDIHPERNVDPRLALLGDRFDFLDSLHGLDDLFHGTGDDRFDLLRGDAGILDDHRNPRMRARRHERDGQAREADEAEDENGGEEHEGGYVIVDEVAHLRIYRGRSDTRRWG